MSSDQELSNRSILRIQQLANEFKEQLNDLPLFSREYSYWQDNKEKEKLKNIFFVSRDADLSNQGQMEPGDRWYNIRLCGSYDFPKAVRRWFTLPYEMPSNHAHCVLPRTKSGIFQATTTLTNLDRFRCFFEVAASLTPTAPTFKAFSDALELPGSDERTAYELFVTALALIPYRGVLLNLFEDAFGPKFKRQSCWFQGTERKMRIWDLDDFSRGLKPIVGPRRQGRMRFPPAVERYYGDELRSLFDQFILPFTRGETPLADPTPQSPYSPVDSAAPPFLSGFVVPAYDTWDEQAGWQGGMAGWVVFFLQTHYRRHFPTLPDRPSRKSIWLSLTQLLTAFVRRVREAHMQELLLDYSRKDTLPSAEDYFQAHIHHLIGWKSSPADSQRAVTLRILPDNGRAYHEVKVELLKDTWLLDTTVSVGARRLCKQFLDGLQMVEELVRLKGARTTLNDISHEVKHVVQCLRGKWMLSPDSALEPALQEFFQRRGLPVSGEVTVCPYPTLIAAASRVIELWTGARDALALFDPEKEPRTVKDVMCGLWALVTDAALALAAFPLRLDKPDQVKEFLKYRSAISAAWDFPLLFSVSVDSSIPVPAENGLEEDNTKWLLVAKIVLAKFTDVLRHASPVARRSVTVVAEGGTLSIVISNVNRKSTPLKGHDDIRALTSALEAKHFFRSEHEGHHILQRLISENSSFVTQIVSPPGRRGFYRYEVRFHWNVSREETLR